MWIIWYFSREEFYSWLEYERKEIENANLSLLINDWAIEQEEQILSQDWNRILREPMHFTVLQVSTLINVADDTQPTHKPCVCMLGLFIKSLELHLVLMIEVHFLKRRKRKKGKKREKKNRKIGKRNLWIWLKGRDLAEERHGSVYAVGKKKGRYQAQVWRLFCGPNGK